MYRPFRLPFLVIATVALLVAGAARSAAAPQHRTPHPAMVQTQAPASDRLHVPQ